MGEAIVASTPRKNPGLNLVGSTLAGSSLRRWYTDSLAPSKVRTLLNGAASSVLSVAGPFKNRPYTVVATAKNGVPSAYLMITQRQR